MNAPQSTIHPKDQAISDLFSESRACIERQERALDRTLLTFTVLLLIATTLILRGIFS